MFGLAAKGLGSVARGLRGYGNMLRHAAQAEGGGVGGAVGKFFTYTTPLAVLGALPVVGPTLRKNLPGGSFLAPSLTGREERVGIEAGDNYEQSRRMAAGARQARGLPRLPTAGPTQRGIDMPTDAYGHRKVAFGQSEEKIKAAHQLRTKLASMKMVQQIDPMHILALGALGTAGSAVASHLIGGALNRLDRTRRDIGKQTAEKRTIGILSRVNPMVAEDPDTRAKAKALFGIVHRNSPYIAKEPIVAASVINTMLHSPTELPTVDMFQQAAKLQKEVEGARERSPFSGKVEGGKPSPQDIVSAVYGGDIG